MPTKKELAARGRKFSARVAREMKQETAADRVARRVVRNLEAYFGDDPVGAVAQRVLEKIQADLAKHIAEMVLSEVAGRCGMAMDAALKAGLADIKRSHDEALKSAAGRVGLRLEGVVADILRRVASGLDD